MKINNYTECPHSFENGNFKVYPQEGQIINVFHKGTAVRMEVIEVGDKYLICDDFSGIEVIVKLRVEREDDNTINISFYSSDY